VICNSSASTLRTAHLFIHCKTNLGTIGGVAQEHKGIFSAQMKHWATFDTAPHRAGVTGEEAVAFYGERYWADAVGWGRKLIL